MNDSRRLKIVIVNSLVAPDGTDNASIEQADRVRALRIGLLENGYNILAALAPGDELEAQLANLQPGLIIVDEHSDTALNRVVAATAHARLPIVCFTEDHDRAKMFEAIKAGVSGYVVAGLSMDRLRAVLDVAVTRFKVEQELRNELEEVRNQLAERKVIERAKGQLMERQQCTEEQAYSKLRRLAMDRNLKLVEVAQRMLDVADLLD